MALLVPLLAITLAAAPERPVKLAAPGFSAVKLDAAEAGFYGDHFAQQLSAQPGIEVITQTQINSLVGLERQKQLMGCTDQGASCLAELANALGVDGLVVGSVGRFKSSYRVTISIIAASDGRELAGFSHRADDDEAMLDALTRAARELAPKVRAGLGRADAPMVKATPPPVGDPAGTAPPPKPDAVAARPPAEAQVVELTASHPLRAWSWAPAAGGVLLAAGGTFFLVQANGYRETLRNSVALPLPDAQTLASEGRKNEAFGLVGLGAGALALGAATWMFLHEPKRSVVLVPSIHGVAVAGVLP